MYNASSYQSGKASLALRCKLGNQRRFEDLAFSLLSWPKSRLQHSADTSVSIIRTHGFGATTRMEISHVQLLERRTCLPYLDKP